MEITNNYSNYVAQSMAGSNAADATKKKEAEKTQETTGSSKSKSTADYANELAKLVPSVDFRIGNSFASAKSGKTLTVNPKLLEKMQNDPKQEKETKELIKGVESMTRLMNSIYSGSGWTVVYKHSYIDENGKYCSTALIRNDYMLKLSDKLREERKKNSEKLLERSKEKAADEEEELQEVTTEKQLLEAEAEKAEEDKTSDKAEQLLMDKAENSEDGIIYLNDEDMKTIMDSIKENAAKQTADKDTMTVGANLDLQV